MYPTKDLFAQELEEIKAAGMWKDIGVLEGKQGPSVQIAGQSFLNFCANNYLGLAASEELVKAAKEGLDKYGFGEASVRFIVGTSQIHKDLESEIAKFFSAEDAITYTSCFDANTGLFETILKEGDAIFSDELNHASIIDGIRLCKAERFRYKHSDMEDLESMLKEVASREVKPRRMLVASDGVFSMDGEVAKIEELSSLAQKYGALLMIDDSHGSGVLGKNGRGSVEGFMDKIDILTSTFGKALGGAGGGFTAGRKEIIQVLHQRSRTTLFSNSLPPAIAAAALYVLKKFDTNPIFKDAQGKLSSNIGLFRKPMQDLGFTLGGDGKHPITPVMLGEEKLASQMAGELYKKGVYVRGFTYPVVPKGKARIRVQLSAAHTPEQIEQAVRAFAEVGKVMGVIK